MNRCNVDGDNYSDLSTLRKAEKIKDFVISANKISTKPCKNINLHNYDALLGNSTDLAKKMDDANLGPRY